MTEPSKDALIDAYRKTIRNLRASQAQTSVALDNIWEALWRRKVLPGLDEAPGDPQRQAAAIIKALDRLGDRATTRGASKSG